MRCFACNGKLGLSCCVVVFVVFVGCYLGRSFA